MKRPGKCLAVIAGCCLGLALSGCGGGGGSTLPTAPTAVSGLVIVPAAKTAPVAKPSGDPGVAVAALEPAAGGTVRLFLADMNGVIDAETTPLAEGIIDAGGHYDLNVPAGLGLTANLVIVATFGEPVQELRAQLVGTITDIDPISDFVFDQTSSGEGLSNVSPADVLVVRGFIAREDGAEDDPATTFTGTLGTALTEVVDDVKADGSTAAAPTGTNVWMEFTANMSTFGGASAATHGGTAAFTPIGTTLMSNNSCTDAAARLRYGFNSVSTPPTSPYFGFSASLEGPDGPFASSPVQGEPDGGITFVDPNEDVYEETFDGWIRYTGGLNKLKLMGHDSWITVLQTFTRNYGDLASEQNPGGIDLTQFKGRSIDLGLQCHIKKGEVQRTDIAGPVGTPVKYALLTMGSRFEAQGSRAINSTISTVDITEGTIDDEVSFAKSGTRDVTLRRAFDSDTYAVNVELSSDSPADPSPDAGTLAPSSGLVTMTEGGELQFSKDGAFMTYVESNYDVSPAGPLWGELEWGVGMKLGIGNPTIDDTTRFRVVMLRFKYADDGSSQMQQSTQTWATYNAGTLTFSGVIGTVQQASDSDDISGASLSSSVTEFSPAYTFAWTDATTGIGGFELSTTGSGAQGFFNAEGVGIATFWDDALGSKVDFAATSGTLGVMILIPTPVPAP